MSRASKPSLPDLINRLAPVVYPTMRERYRADCCVAAAAILTRVFSEYGYKAEVVPVSVEVYNPAMVRLLNKGVEIPHDPQRRAMFFDLTGAWGVGILPAKDAIRVSPNALRDSRGRMGYAGHLLLRIKEFLIDATIKQVERLERDIAMPDLIATAHAEDLERTGHVALEVGSCVVRYSRIFDESYRTAPDWQRRSTPFPETVRKILTRLEAQ